MFIVVEMEICERKFFAQLTTKHIFLAYTLYLDCVYHTSMHSYYTLA